MENENTVENTKISSLALDVLVRRHIEDRRLHKRGKTINFPDFVLFSKHLHLATSRNGYRARTLD